MIDFATARRMMVDGQVHTADVTDPRLLAAMLDLPRERFLPEDKAQLAYLDLDVAVNEPTAAVRRMLKPMVFAKLIQAADVGEGDHVLDVGCATGYSTAVLSRVAGSVVGLEEEAALAQFASAALAETGAANAKVVTGPLVRGLAGEGPYDVIVLEGAVEVIPDGILDQLKNGGRLVCVLQRGPAGRGMIYLRTGRDISGRVVFDAAAAPLPGFAEAPAFVF